MGKIVKISFFTGLMIIGVSTSYAQYPNYDRDGYGYDDYDRGYDRQRDVDRERADLERERRRLDYERGILDAQRDQQRDEYSKPAKVVETCPPGFSPSEQKCSKEERKRGCKDMRLPGGLGCVHR